MEIGGMRLHLTAKFQRFNVMSGTLKISRGLTLCSEENAMFEGAIRNITRHVKT